MNRPLRSKTRKNKLPARNRRVLKFSQVKGKTLEEVEFSTGHGSNSISLLFRDKTALHFNIEPGFTLFSEYADWKTGDMEPIREWKPVRSWLFRES